MDKHGSYFTRCISSTSAGGLISGKGKGSSDRRLSDTDLHSEFVNHLLPHAINPTALISTSNRLIDTLRRGFSKLYEDDESPDQIWILFIYVPEVDKHVYHHAESLAKKWNYPESRLLRYEYIFEWQIPEKYLLHKISVETLIKRGFDMKEYLFNHALPPTSSHRQEVAKRILDPSNGGYHIGLNLGILARRFGARAPVRQVALQLLRDCSNVRSIDHEAQIVRVSYWGHHVNHLDFAHFRDIEDGIDTALNDWWLADPDFFAAYEEYCAWTSHIKDDIEREWDFLHEAVCDDHANGGINIEKYRRNAERLQAKQCQGETQIENAAVSLGL